MPHPPSEYQLTARQSQNEPRALFRLRISTAGLLALAGFFSIVGSLLQQFEHAAPAIVAWRVSFSALVGVLLINTNVVFALFTGRVHLAAGIERSVPLVDADIIRHDRFGPNHSRFGVQGRGALLGMGLLVLSALMWLGVLGFAQPIESGILSVSLGRGDNTMRLTSTGQTMRLSNQHIWTDWDEDQQALTMRVELRELGEEGTYTISPGNARVLSGVRISLVSVSESDHREGIRVLAQRTDHDGDGPMASQLDLWLWEPVNFDGTTWELIEIRPRFLQTPYDGALVQETSSSSTRQVWLVPGMPDLDQTHHHGEWNLQPVRILSRPVAMLGFSPQWLWHWRIVVVFLAGFGALLFVLMPHRSWLWAGKSGAYRIRIWSLNNASGLVAWADDLLFSLTDEPTKKTLAECESKEPDADKMCPTNRERDEGGNQ